MKSKSFSSLGTLFFNLIVVLGKSMENGLKKFSQSLEKSTAP